MSELAGLKTQNIDLGASSIKVMGKGSKERIIPLVPELEPVSYTHLDVYKRQMWALFRIMAMANE